MEKNPLTDSIITDTLLSYGITLSPTLCDSIRTYIHLLLRWNEKIALTTVVDPLEILKFHFGESMFAVDKIPIRHGRLADVGTGPGFPGIPLRMLAPELNCVLIESNSKKSAFLAEVARTLQLANVSIFRGRMEDYPRSEPGFDFAICRALGIHAEFLEWSASYLNPEGQAVFWVGDRDSAEISRNHDWQWSQCRIPFADHRVILAGFRRSQST